MNDTVITVDNVSKKFCRSIKHTMLYGSVDLGKSFFGMDQKTDRLRNGEFWAATDVSFEVKRGECLGIIGLNGSGKTTMLKMLNGIYMPDKGRIEINGRVGALIEVGAGFHPMLTGRENIYVNGSILGMAKSEIDEKFNDIVEFADIGESLDSPVKHYSSGMYVRLGFAVAAHCEPDILLVDEVLAVGDFKFRQKCSERINDIRKNASVLFVSHSLRDITMICTKVIVFKSGKAVFQGTPEDAVDFYLRIMDAEEEVIRSEKEGEKGIANTSLYGDIYHNKEKITDVQHQWIDGSGNTVEIAEHGSNLTLKFSFKLLKPVDNLIIGVPVWNQGGHLITGISTDMERIKINISSSGLVKGKLKIHSIIFNPGTYRSILTVHDGREFLYRGLIDKFCIRDNPFCFGMVTPEYSWQFEEDIIL